MNVFDDSFERLTGHKRHDWQARLAADAECSDRLMRIPTGFGKTAGVTIAWLWNRVHRKNDAWPRRLVLCLPMRTLVEQTERAVSEWISKAELNSRVKVHFSAGNVQRLVRFEINVVACRKGNRDRQHLNSTARLALYRRDC